MVVDPQRFAAKLVQLRRAHLLSQMAAADRIGVSLRQYTRWEAGLAPPRLSSVGRVVDGYGLDPLAFMVEISDESEGFAARLARVEETADQTLELLREHLPALVAAVEALEPPRADAPSARRPSPTRKAS